LQPAVPQGGEGGQQGVDVPFLPPGPGTARILLCHAVQRFVELTDLFPGSGEFGGVREGLADAAARVGDLAAGVLDVGQGAGLARLELGEAVFQACHQADGIGVAQAGGGQVLPIPPSP
jgi:hypothetical protein